MKEVGGEEGGRRGEGGEGGGGGAREGEEWKQVNRHETEMCLLIKPRFTSFFLPFYVFLINPVTRLFIFFLSTFFLFFLGGLFMQYIDLSPYLPPPLSPPLLFKLPSQSRD